MEVGLVNTDSLLAAVVLQDVICAITLIDFAPMWSKSFRNF